MIQVFCLIKLLTREEAGGNDLIRGNRGSYAVRQFKISYLDNTTSFQVGDVGNRSLRDCLRGTFHLQFRKNKFENSASLDAGALSPELHGHRHEDFFGEVDSQEINMQRFGAIGIPLQFADERRSGDCAS